MKSNIMRLLECLTCKYFEVCAEKVSDPEDYPDGTCKTKFVEEWEKKKNENKSKGV